MTAYHSALPRYSSFAGLQNAADAAGRAFVAAEADDKTQIGWAPAIIGGGIALAIAALVLLLA